MKDGSSTSQLIIANKNLELNSAVMATRIPDFVVREARFTFAKVYIRIDSDIVLAMLQKDSNIRCHSMQQVSRENNKMILQILYAPINTCTRK